MGKYKYKKNKRKENILIGQVIAHPDGYGFVICDNHEDVYLGYSQMENIMHADKVKIKAHHNVVKNKFSGHVVEIIERAHETIPAKVTRVGSNLCLFPTDKRINYRIYTAKKSLEKYKDQDVVSVKITQYPSYREKLKGEIVALIGSMNQSSTVTSLILAKYLIPHLWPEQAKIDAKNAPKNVNKQDISSRVDLRKLPFITIDGKTARDFDDAIYIKENSQGCVLYVAIADVSYYIEQHCLLDKLAYQRGTSVYLPDQVIPMLPEAYSNHICSLMPDVDRLCMVCEIHLDADAGVESFQFYEAVIRSQARLTYEQVWQFFNEGNVDKLNKNITTSLKDGHVLFKKLLLARQNRNALELDIPEVVIYLDDDNELCLEQVASRNDAHRLIEEFMLLANVCAANLMKENLKHGMYRIHEIPDTEKLTDLRQFLNKFDLQLGGGDTPEVKNFVELLESKEIQQQWSYIVSMMILRTQKQAKYDSKAGLHFALNYECYTHFTSPIRRYPDLMVHRLIKSIVNKTTSTMQNSDALTKIAEECSITERRAESASREVVSFYKLKYLATHIGEIYSGLITGVENYGMFVELDQILTSGLVHVSTLGNEYFSYDATHKALIGEMTGKVYNVGQRISVEIREVDLDDKKLNLVINEKAPLQN